MTDNYDQLAIGWVRKEINNTLEQARQGLETFAEDGQDQTQIQFCINCLHQVHGTMQMLGLEGAARLTLEMETLANKLANNEVVLKDSSFEILMRSMLQMPGYLERVEGGQKDLPLVLLPLINELRSASSLPPVKENEFFSAEISAVNAPKPHEKITENEKKSPFKESCKKLRAHFNKGLSGITQGENIKESLARMHKVLLKLEAFSEGASLGKLWWIADGFIFSIMANGLYKEKEIHDLLKRVDDQIKILVSAGKEALDSELPENLLSKLLYFIGRSNSKNKRVTNLQQEFDLIESPETREFIERQQQQLTRPDSTVIASVVEAIGEELASVKDQLDLFVRAQLKDPAQLQSLCDSLVRIADTLEILALPMPRDVIREQAAGLQKCIDQKKLPDDAAVMDIAGALLFVDANLNNIDLDADQEESNETAQEVAEQRSKANQVDEATVTLVTVARKNLQLAKDGLIGYIASNYDISELELVPKLISDVLGAMKIVDFDQAAEILETARSFISERLLTANRAPRESHLDALADIVTSVDYYLEGIEEGNNKAIASILNSAKPSQDMLLQVQQHGSEVTSITSNVSAEGLGQPGQSSEASRERSQDGDLARASFEDSPSAQIVSINHSSANKKIDESLIDDEVLEIFLEEADEEIEVIEEALPRWISDIQNRDPLVTMRRSFHTLKGSGRLVGAVTIGELSWAVENMLNKVIEDSIPAENPVLGVLNNTLTKLPNLVKEFSNNISHQGDDINEIIARAGHISKGLNLSEFEFAATSAEGVKTDATANDIAAIPTLSERVDSADVEEPIDPVLLEIFVAEAQVHIKAINDFLAGVAPQSKAAVTDGLIRALHTLKGSAHMAKVDPVAKIAGPLEKFSRAVKGNQKRLEVNVIELLSSCTSFLSDAISQLETSTPIDNEMLELLLQRIHALGHAGNKGSGKSKNAQQENLVGGYLTQGSDLLQKITELLAQAKNSPEDGSILNKIGTELQRFSHVSEKLGNNDLLHFAKICGSVSHVKANSNDDRIEFQRLLAGGVEELSGMLNRVVSEEDLHMPSALVEEMQSWVAETSRGTAPDDMDQELVELFVEEADELLESIDELMPRWERHLGRPEINKELRRIYHTFKGSSRMAGAMNIGDISHAVEDLFDTAIEQGRKITEIDYRLVDSSNHKLIEMIEILRGFQWPPAADSEILRLRNHLNNEYFVEVGQETPQASKEVSQDLAGVAERIKESLVKGAPSKDGLADGISTFEVSESPETVIEASEARISDLESKTPVTDDLPSKGLASAEQPKEPQKNREQPYLRKDSSDVVKTEDTIEPAAPVISVDNVFPINLDEDGLEVLEIFLEEADELLVTFDESLHLWSEDYSDNAAIDVLLRALHTLKGGARLADLVVLGDLTHEIETYFEKVLEGGLERNQSHVTHIIQGYDVIESLVNEIRHDNQMTFPQVYMATLKKIIAGENIRPQADILGEKQDTKAKISAKQETTEDKETSSKIVSLEQHKQRQEDRRQPAPTVDTVRVNSSQLETLVNLAGETSIFRSRLEQQMSVLRYNLEEMNSTVDRLKDQLRNLDIETEAQISYRREISGGIEYDDFDPLEMDRYTRQQELTRGLGESAVDLVNLKETLDSLTSDSETLLLQQGRVNTEMQESLMQTRMTPFESLVPRLRRMVRQIGTELGKTIELSISADGEMDRSVLERMIAPLEHMLRNAMDHGIESPAQRKKSNKSETGKISISLYREGSEVFIKIKDDGRGLDLEAIRRKAIERGLIKKNTALNEGELRQLILEAGFSTAEKVTQISGRGVGMDVVNSEIKQLGGIIEINSKEGHGSTFTVRLPFTVSVNQALMVKVGENVYAIPLSNIEGIVRVSPFELEEYYENTQSKFAYAGIDYSMYYLGAMLDHQSQARLDGVAQPLPVLLLHGADHPTALQVDDLLGSREIVVKSIGSQLSTVSGLSGATIQGDGRVVLILDMPALIRRVDAQIEDAPLIKNDVQEDRVPTVMVVDDSITVRKVTTRLLERHDFEVFTAKDGVDAVTMLADTVPDVMLLDIEMPRMDGFELATIIRHDERLKNIPIIMITSRTGEKHRQRAESIGVNRYMGKPYNEVDLLDTINDLLTDET